MQSFESINIPFIRTEIQRTHIREIDWLSSMYVYMRAHEVDIASRVRDEKVFRVAATQ